MPFPVVYALHGFLGRAADWKNVKESLQGVNFIADELFGQTPEALEVGPVRGKVFLGYSLGGRLGLQILKRSPEAFERYIFVSTNPGIPEDERPVRLKHDQAWAEKISSQTWEQFLAEWNAQAVFQGSGLEPERLLQDYDIAKLKRSLDEWSLGRQEDFSELLRLHQNKITWVVGDRDVKYVQIAEGLRQKKILLDYKRIPGGHRLWLDNPGAVAGIIQEYL